MKRNSAPVLVLLLTLGLGVLSSPAAFSATPATNGGRTAMHHALFNPKTIETVQGKVTAITTPKSRKAMAMDMHLTLQTEHGTMPVDLGPTSYIDKEAVKLAKGDNISVTGSRVMMHKKAELVATEVKKGNETLDLRKADGTPLWSTTATQGSAHK